jgi:hypothetical protein
MDNDCELTLNKRFFFEECSLFLTLIFLCGIEKAAAKEFKMRIVFYG